MKDRIRIVRQSIRKKPKVSQTEFAEMLGTTRNAIASYETGKVIPNDTFIQLVCSKFSISEEWLRTGAGEMLQETEETLFSSFAARYDLSVNEQALAHYLLDLSSDERQAVLKHILAMADAIRDSQQQVAPPVHPSERDSDKVDPIDQEVADYRKELEAEKKGIRSPASGTGNEKRA